MRDLERDPPTRAFLERHVSSVQFLDFVSQRSPVFKQRPLPKSKKEAINLMMKNPKLIKRPIIISGRTVIFGFDKSRVKLLKKHLGFRKDYITYPSVSPPASDIDLRVRIAGREGRLVCKYSDPK